MSFNRDPKTCFVLPFTRLTASVIYSLIGEVISENKQYIAGLNRIQLYQGTRADGSEITPDYTPTTVRLKQKKGQVTDRVTTRDTGRHYASIFVEVFAKAFHIDASDEKSPTLVEKYGELLYGLTDDSRAQLIDFIRPQLLAKVRAFLLT